MDNYDPAAAASLDDLAACLRHIHLLADRPTFRALEQQTTHASGLLPGTTLRRARLTRTTVSDVLLGRKFPTKAFLLTFVAACGVDLENDRRWEQAWDRLAVQGGQASAPLEEIEKLRLENEELRQQLMTAKRQAEILRNHQADQGRGHPPAVMRRLPPTRALIVEDIEAWAFTLSRAARRAGVSEVVVCNSRDMVIDALRVARFDIAILEVWLDPDDDLNSDGIKVLEAIRQVDGLGTQCVLVTGWQGGDRMNLQATLQQKYGVDWAFMKEKYEAFAMIAKLTELLEQREARRLSSLTPMENLGASLEPFRFQDQLIRTISPDGGVSTLYTAVSRLVGSVIPLLAQHPEMPMEQISGGVWIGVYWSRTLAAPVAVGLASSDAGNREYGISVDWDRFMPAGTMPDLIDRVRERNVLGWLWELPGLDRDQF